MESTRGADLAILAKKGCKHCHGRGFTGTAVHNGILKKVACSCAIKNHAKLRKVIIKRQLREMAKHNNAPWWKKAWWRIQMALSKRAQ